jgi:hypothetical protein
MSSSKLSMRKYTRDLRQRVLNHLGRKCVRCSFDDERALQVDHIYGGGNKQRRIIAWREMYRMVLNSIPGDKYQLLCANCNWIKRSENAESLRQVRTNIYRTRRRLLQSELNEKAISRRKFWGEIFNELQSKPMGEEIELKPGEETSIENLRAAFVKAGRHRGFYVSTRTIEGVLFGRIVRINPWVKPIKD